MEVAEETKNKSFLGYGKIKVKGFGSGLMNPVIEILCEGEKVCLGAFSLRGLNGGQQGYRTAGVTTRAILQQRTQISGHFCEERGSVQNIRRSSLGNRRWNQVSANVPSSSSHAEQCEKDSLLVFSKVADVDVNRENSLPESPEKELAEDGITAVLVRSGRRQDVDKTKELNVLFSSKGKMSTNMGNGFAKDSFWVLLFRFRR